MTKQIRSASEQVFDMLLEELQRGRWSGKMPGVYALCAELDLPRKPVEMALEMLEQQGLLKSQGVGRKRSIVMPRHFKPPVLRVKILHYDESDFTHSYIIGLQHQLMESGHHASFAPNSLVDLDRDVKRVARMVSSIEADAWIIISAPRDVLQWFSEQPVPCFAMFGQRNDVSIAGTGPHKLPAVREAIRQLIRLGHRKIVMLVRKDQLKPSLGYQPRAFLEELEQNNIPINAAYNLPEWDDSGDGLRSSLDSLFQLTPPTALIMDEAFAFLIVQHHLAQKGVFAPKQVSLICLDPSPVFSWSAPSVAHIRWDSSQVVRRIVDWANNMARGAANKRQTTTKAQFVLGDSIGAISQ